MYRPLRGFWESVSNLFVGVQTSRLDNYTSYSKGNVYDKFQCCTVDVQAATWFIRIST